ncbi:MAG: tetratricopeptide repeat protein [Treponema sp.]|jgi:Tfp pilus assembly protein PilF|nr:tetratricopeptide repeat protein [Treponema sp.]
MRPQNKEPSRYEGVDSRSMQARGLKQHKHISFRLCFVISLMTLTCASSRIQETSLPTQAPLTNGGQAVMPRGGGIADDIRALIESGIPDSLNEALDLIRSRELGGSEFGRNMNYVIVTLFKMLYPDITTTLPVADPSPNHVYTKIIRNVAQGVYISPPADSQDFLEYVLPFLAFFSPSGAKPYATALPDIRRATELNPDSVLPPYFMGLIYEHTGSLKEARSSFERAVARAATCYPAAIGLARVIDASGQKQVATSMLQEMVNSYPDNMAIKRQLALNYYNNRDWSRAESAIAEILQKDSKNADFTLMRAHVLVEEGQLVQAQAALEQYAPINPNNRLYLFLRARIQAEGYRNRDAALTYLRAILKSPTVNDEISLYTARLLLESRREDDQNEGRSLLSSLLNEKDPAFSVIALAFQDALNRKAWDEAAVYLDRVLEEQRSARLLDAYKIEDGRGNKQAALAYAQEFHQQKPANEEGTLTLATALVETGASDEASRLIESRLADLSSGNVKSQYYYLRSRLRDNDTEALEDLRSSNFEDPRNLAALVGLFEVYQRQGDERHAVFYLKQAIALAPDAPELQAYKQRYASELSYDPTG